MSPIASRSLACLGVGEDPATVSWCRDRTLPSHGLLLVSAGHGHYLTPHGRSFEVNAPAALWLFPGVQHSYGPDHNGWMEHWVLFSGRMAGIYQELGLADRGRPVMPLQQRVDVTKVFAALRSALNEVSIHSQLRASALAQEFIGLVAAAGRQSDSVPNLYPLTQAPELPLSIPEWADRLKLSTKSLRRLVRQETGLNPREYIQLLRINKAQQLLADSQQPVREVGQNVGYDDPAYFSRVFHSVVGMSPAQFRRQQNRELFLLPEHVLVESSDEAAETDLTTAD